MGHLIQMFLQKQKLPYTLYTIYMFSKYCLQSRVEILDNQLVVLKEAPTNRQCLIDGAYRKSIY